MPRSNSSTQLPSQRCGQHGYGLWNAPGRCVHRAGKDLWRNRRLRGIPSPDLRKQNPPDVRRKKSRACRMHMTALTHQVSDPLRPTAAHRSQPVRGEMRTGAAGAQGGSAPAAPAMAATRPKRTTPSRDRHPRAVRPQGGWPRAPDRTGVSVGRVGQNENASPGGKTASGEPQDLVKECRPRPGSGPPHEDHRGLRTGRG